MENCESDKERILSLCQFIDSYYENLPQLRQQQTINCADKQTQTENQKTFFNRFFIDFLKSVLILILYKVLIEFLEN